MTTDTPAQGTGVFGAAQQFEAMMAAGNSENQQPEQETAPDAEAGEAEALTATEAEEETLAADDAESASEDEAAAEDEEAEQPSDPLDSLVTVKIDGKEEQIPLREAINGYQRQADYSRKTAALSEQRRAFEGEIAAVQQERAQYAQLLTALQTQLQQSQPQEPDWERLYAEDPLEYVRQKENWRDRQERLAAAQIELQRVQQTQQYEEQRAVAEMVQQGRAKLVEAIPAWKSPEKMEADRAKLREYGQRLGFSDEELAQAYDYRAVVALYKAMKFDELMSNKPRPSTAPGAPKTAPAGGQSSVPPRREVSDITRAKQRLAKTGRVDDAAAIFASFLK